MVLDGERKKSIVHMKEIRYVMIIGAMKSGTSSLYTYLSRHPEICPCKKKEPEFFSTHQRHGASVIRYEELWNFAPSTHRYCLEASTGYTKYPFEQGVPQRIKRYGLSPKFIYIVRDPVERIESQFNFMRLSLGMSPAGFTDPRLIELSKYHQQLTEFMRVFPDRDRYLVLDFEELKMAPKRVVERCTTFLDIRSDYDFERTVPQNKTPRRKLEIWIKQIGAIKNMIGGLMSDRQRRAVKRSLGWFTPSVEYIEMNVSDRVAIRDLLRSDVAKFENEFQFDVSKWGF